jgi:hypothetical protein
MPASAARGDQGIFEEHYWGVVDLVGENADDDARGLLKSNEQQQFLDNADLLRRELHKKRAPRAGDAASSLVSISNAGSVHSLSLQSLFSSCNLPCQDIVVVVDEMTANHIIAMLSLLVCLLGELGLQPSP